MSLATTIPWFLSVMALACSIGACVVTRRSSGRYLSKQLDELSARLAALESLNRPHREKVIELNSRMGEAEELLERLSLAHRNLRSRLNMQDHRAKNAVTNGPSADDPDRPMTEAEKDAWTRETNLRIATGQLKVR